MDKDMTGKEIFPVDQTILDMCKLIDEKRFQIKQLTDSMKTLKEEVRGLMIENDLNYAANEEFEVKMVIPKSFDLPMLRYGFPKLAKELISETKVTNVVVEVSKENKKLIKEKYPDVWEEIQAEGTPRLTIKRRT